MPRWTRGEAGVEQPVARGELERVSGAAADGTPLLEQARKTAATAAGLVSSDAYSAYVLAYDAARFACIALLAQQGLRATTSGEIAAQLFVGEATVKTHVSRVMTKLGARDRIQAVVLAYENDMA